MAGFTDVLRQRLLKLGMPFDGEQLARAEALVRNASDQPQSIDDVSLMTIAVEAYRGVDGNVREVV